MPANDQDGSRTGGAPAGGPAVVPGTEQAAVAAQLREIDGALTGLAQLPVDAQVAVFTDLHRQLTEALAVTATATGPADERPPHRPGQPAHRGR